MALHPSTVLVVDDDPLARALVQSAAGGRTVLEASTAADAFRQVAAGPHPDLVVLDIAMPGTSGLEALAALKGQALGYTGPVLVWSAWDDPATRQAVLEAGARFIRKPVDLVDLAREIAEARA